MLLNLRNTFLMVLVEFLTCLTFTEIADKVQSSKRRTEIMGTLTEHPMSYTNTSGTLARLTKNSENWMFPTITIICSNLQGYLCFQMRISKFDNSYCMDQMIESTTHILIWYVVLNFKKDDLQSAANTEFSANSYMYFVLIP